MLLLVALLACVRTSPRPDPGDCAVPPDGAYTWGEIGLGTCLSGPAKLQFAGSDDDPVLLVTNADPYYQFTGGSLLAIPWSALDVDAGRNVVTDLGAAAVDLPHFVAGLSVGDDEAYVTSRYSEDSLTRSAEDALWVLDISDPFAPALSSRGDDGGSSVAVQADPVTVQLDASTGFAFVGNRTSHTISVVDTMADPVEIVQPWTEAIIRGTPLDDNDGSGSTGELADLTIEDTDLLPDDTWTLTWHEGTWRLWLEADGGLVRVSSQGGTEHVASGYGLELDFEDYDDLTTTQDPCFFDGPLQGRLLFVDDGDIRGAVSDTWLADWEVEEDALLTGDEGAWDATVGGPHLLLDEDTYWLFYDGTDGETWGIGVASSSDGVEFRRSGEVLLTGENAHESVRISDPTVFYDPQIDRWRMYYSAYDGARWTIGHATSIDLTHWTADAEPVFELEGIDAAAPVISGEVGAFRLWYSRREAGTWSLGAATSPDGTHWTDLGAVYALDAAVATGDEPPGPALQASPTSGFDLVGETYGTQYTPVYPGDEYESSDWGFSLLIEAGHQLGPDDIGAEAEGGVALDSVDLDAGLAWLTVFDRAGEARVEVAEIDAEGDLHPSGAIALEGTDGAFDEDGVSSPTVLRIDGVYHMYYAGLSSEISTIGLATSDDGLTWTAQGQVLDVEADAWDGSGLLPGSAQILDDGRIRLWYTGTNGDIPRIGSAISDDGLSFTREEGETKPWIFTTGSPGEWDDSGVRDPYVISDEEGDQLWYAGYDGEQWYLGYASRAAGESSWTRSTDEASGETRSILGVFTGMFHADGVLRPVPTETDDGWVVYFTGEDEGVLRVGRAIGAEPDRLHEVVSRPTVGDSFTFVTERGDEDALSIPLDVALDDRYLTGEGLVSSLLDASRGLLYLTSSHTPDVIVVDVRDDSSGDDRDLNYLDIEAAFTIPSAQGATSGIYGLRGMELSADGSVLYVLSEAPDAVYALDLSRLVDDSVAEVITDATLGYMAAPQGLVRDEGADSVSGVASAEAVLHPDGQRLFVTAYNANSVILYDLGLGTYGEAVAEITNIGEGPYDIVLSPDGRYAVIANYLGEVSEDGEVSSTLAVLDIDESSPSYLEVVTWIANR